MTNLDEGRERGSRHLSRRRFLRRAVWGGVILAGGGVLWSLDRERHGIRVRRVHVPLPDLPPALDRFTICQLSDLHCGPYSPEQYLRHAAETAMSLRADLIAITGDYVWREAKYAAAGARAISSLCAPYGVYGVLGNHDYWSGEVGRVIQAMNSVGVQVLVNDSVPMKTNGQDWWLCGVDDVWAGDPSLAETLTGVPKGAFRILLCHEPDFADEATRWNIPFQLSGHSHGGQVRLPFIGPPILPNLGRKYPIRLQRVAQSSMLVYTNVGLGMIAPPIRLNCPPEITHLTLARGPRA